MSPDAEFLSGAVRIVVGGCLTVAIYDWAAPRVCAWWARVSKLLARQA